MKPIIFAWIIAALTITLCRAEPVKVSSDFTLGVIPGTDLALYEVQEVQQILNLSATYLADYQVKAKIYEIGFIDGGINCFSTQHRNGFRPFRLDFNIGAGAVWKNYTVGWMYGCYHPIAPNWSRMPLPLINASQNLFYIKIHMGEK